MDPQRTIAAAVTLSGKGLFGGQPANVTFRPAPANHGVVFVRTDLERAQIPARIDYVVKRARRSAIRCGQAVVETTEHCLSALAGLGIDNLLVEIDAPELPGLDGSAKPYYDTLLQAGLRSLDVPRRRLVIREPVMVRHDDATVAAVPSDEPTLQVLYELDYSRHPAIGRQIKLFDLLPPVDGAPAKPAPARNGRDTDYAGQIAPARTFVLEAEAKALHAAGIGTHLTPQDVLVISPEGPMGGNSFRFADEPVRHKIVDLLGDLFLLGASIQGRIIAHKSGHALNQQLVRELTKQLRQQVHEDLLLKRNLIDIRRLSRILPHRYPMLLIDRIIEIDGDRRALGVKNVTMNEPFFQGHFPGTPIMPGVLIVEAMAQLSGVLIGQNLENAGRLAVLLSLDRVKLRKPVTPGDQLVLEAEAVRVRSRVAHTRCRAYVGQELAAEAEVKFMLVNNDQV